MPANLHDDDAPIPMFLRKRPAGPAIDHIAFARDGYEAELQRTAQAIKTIDLRMEDAQERLTALRRQQAEDSRELELLVRAKRSAERAIAELDGVEL